MIKVSDEVKRLYHQENVPKQLIIPIRNNSKVSGVNMFYGFPAGLGYVYNMACSSNQYWPLLGGQDDSGLKYVLTDFVEWGYIKHADYICISLDLKITNIVSGTFFAFQVYARMEDGTAQWYLSDYLSVNDFGNFRRVHVTIPTTGIKHIENLGLGNPASGNFPAFEFKATATDYMVELGNNKYIMPSSYVASPVMKGESISDYVTIDDVQFEPIKNDDIVAESFSLNESLCSQENLKFGLCESSYITFSMVGRDDKIRGCEIAPRQIIGGDEVPLGTYTVESVRKNTKAKCVQKDITAYDALYKLNQVVEDWYTQYMFGIDTSDGSRQGFEFARQIFSTYYNLAKHLGIEKGDYPKKEVATYASWELRNNLSEKYIKFDSENMCCWYAAITIDNPDVTRPYMLEAENAEGYSLEYVLQYKTMGYTEHFDSLGRGILQKASVLVEETREGKGTNRFLCDCGDQFLLSPDTTSIKIYYPSFTGDEAGDLIVTLTDHITIYQIDRQIDLANGANRLMYYNYMTKEIFPCTSEVTGRDIVRSLMEVCGCFYTLDRQGRPAFRYCTKAGLYPSETLYPKDELFPILNSEETLAPAFYYDFDCEDYEVQDFGRIQILKQTVTNEAKSIVQWQYTGDDSKGNTYIIDDNVFYCHENMEYDYDGMPEVSEMLENMYARISNIGYTPHDTQAIGLPYMECGDRISLLTQDGGIETFIFSRNLSGIQSMVDNYESHGTEKNKAISDFGYTEWGMNNG